MIHDWRPRVASRGSRSIAAPFAALVVASGLAGCAGSLGADGPGSDGGDGPPCHPTLTYDPTDPVAGPMTTIRVSANTVGISGYLDYIWHVSLDGTPVAVMYAQDDRSQIDFLASTPGAYMVNVDVTGAPASCTSSIPINVRAPGALSSSFRLRVVPPQTVAAPPFEKTITIDGGASFDLGIVGVDPGISVQPQITGPGGGVPAYLRFAPPSALGAIVEGAADAAGHVTVRLLPQPYDVLVIPPSVSGNAPRQIASWIPSNTALAVDAGTPVTGTVHDPADLPLAGATVQLSIGGVPSTVATTAGDGSFTVRAVPAGSAEVTVEVTPPRASGLPRLSATSQAFDLGVPVQVRYAPGLAHKDLAGLRIVRQGVPVAGAAVTVVGSLALAGTVTAGTSAAATGDVRIATSAGAGGTLPSTLVPAAALSAVITVAAGDLAVAALDTTAALPASLDAPAMHTVSTAVQDPGAAGLRGAVLDLVPAGALAMAAVPVLHLTAGTSGAITAALADGGHYDLRFHDPAGRAAPRLIPDCVAATVVSAYRLPAALQVRGSLVVGGTQVLANASVQILCDACTGLEREKPIAEAASDDSGRFTLAVPDPGIMAPAM